MKTKLRLLFPGLVLLASLAQCQFARAGVAFSITPAAVSNNYNGSITLLVTGLNAGDTVTVQEFVDANTNGVIDAGDILLNQFALTDGSNSVIGGLTNVNVPGDTDSMAGQITANLNFRGSFSHTTVGQYLIRLSSPAGLFTPITNSFTVANFPYAQAFTGTVVGNGVAVPNALVLLYQPTGSGALEPVEGTVANNSGNYLMQAPTGAYSLVAWKSNFVGDTTAAASLVLGAGATINTNLSLIAATRSISGKIVDANDSSVGLPGFLVAVQSLAGLLGIGFTDTNGNFTAQVNVNLQWTMTPSYHANLALHGYVGLQSNVTVVNIKAGSVSNVTITLPKATALFYGAVKDGLGKPRARSC